MAEDESREFEDREGTTWTIRTAQDFKWYFEPADGAEATRHIVTPPPNVDDPSELDDEELQKLLDAGLSTQGITEPAGPAED